MKRDEKAGNMKVTIVGGNLRNGKVGFQAVGNVDAKIRDLNMDNVETGYDIASQAPAPSTDRPVETPENVSGEAVAAAHSAATKNGDDREPAARSKWQPRIVKWVLGVLATVLATVAATVLEKILLK